VHAPLGVGILTAVFIALSWLGRDLDVSAMAGDTLFEREAARAAGKGCTACRSDAGVAQWWNGRFPGSRS
jgi:hypothetical protein